MDGGIEVQYTCINFWLYLYLYLYKLPSSYILCSTYSLRITTYPLLYIHIIAINLYCLISLLRLVAFASDIKDGLID